MTANEIRERYLEFFKEKGHVIIPSASLIPENDPTTLFTGSGMQPMITYLLGAPHPLGVRLADSQKCFRSQDIEEVGDNRHTTMFEMLGNWSLGDYFKREQIAWMFEFLTKELGLDPKRLYVTVFRGSEKYHIPRDEETVGIWQAQFEMVGVPADAVDGAEKDGMQDGRIFYYDETKNWWSRSGTPEKMPSGEPGGADTEMFWDFGAELELHEHSQWREQPCHVNCDCGRFMEIGNNVFIEYVRTKDGFEPLRQKNVDFGGGLERLAAAVADTPDIFLTDLFRPALDKIAELSNKTYKGNERAFRIITDHVRAATFIIGDEHGVAPSNVGQGYIVRRLLRRAIREGRRLGITDAFTHQIAEVFVGINGSHYQELEKNLPGIIDEMRKEEERFGKTLEKGTRELEKMLAKGKVTGEQAFLLFSTYGFPIELTEEMLAEKGQTIDRSVFESEFKKHQELSRSASAGTFKGGLADASEETTKLHTATHLLHRALMNVLGDHVEQRGSNITKDRLRFDFTHSEKITPEQIAAVEQEVNRVISEDLPVTYREMTMEEAKAAGAIGYFEDKYAKLGNKVKVYFIGDDKHGYYSKEICGGPHVEHTGELGGFKITKEESASAGVRRIKAVLG